MSSSWENWATSCLTTGAAKQQASHHAGVFGLDGSVWGATDEVAREIPKDFFMTVSTIMSGGPGAGKLKIKDKSYITIRSDANLLIAKSGAGGMTVSKSKQTYVIGLYDDESVQPSNNCLAVTSICDALKDCGY
ncbi:profilin-A-like [Haliotis rubra]|uniref:profilin-A-like n=1 Tax=Haliotis rubra TaxID=36100 RepID=UPI001EE55437|nr:profilin-A-like [Haliotis rubra]